MEFYITPDMRDKCERKLLLMFKHWSEKPTIEYSKIEQVVKETIYVYRGGCPEENGLERTRQKFDAIKVTISDLSAGDWKLAAEVIYKDGIVAMVDDKLFKKVPKGFGLEYKKCDFCGSTHNNRSKSFIIYNTVTNEWKQVGSTCVSKMLPCGKYLNNITVKLHEVFQVYLGGCDEDEWRGGWKPKGSQYFRKAIRFDYAISICEKYIAEFGTKWKKPEYDRGYKVSSGTNDALIGYEVDNKNIEINTELADKVRAYYDTKEGGYSDWDNEPNFVQKIKNAFENEYIEVGQMFLPFFALKDYQDSLTFGDYEKLLEENGITKGGKFLFVGKIEEYEKYETVDWCGYKTTCYMAHMKDRNGIAFEKSVSYRTMLDAYKIDDETYAFMCNVRYIDKKKRIVSIGGRVSKAKGYKYIKTNNN